MYALGLAAYETFFMQVYKVPIDFLASKHVSFDFLRYCGFMLIKKLLPSDKILETAFETHLLPCLFLNMLFRQVLLAEGLKHY